MNHAIVTAMLVADEGEVLHAYQDHLGYWTIGVGHLIDARRGGGITRRISRLILDDDIDDRLEGTRRYPWFERLDDVRQAVVIGMLFQLGAEGFHAFAQTRAALEAGDYTLAAARMLDSKWAREDTPGRATKYAHIMRTGEWPYDALLSQQPDPVAAPADAEAERRWLLSKPDIEPGERMRIGVPNHLWRARKASRRGAGDRGRKAEAARWGVERRAGARREVGTAERRSYRFTSDGVGREDRRFKPAFGVGREDLERGGCNRARCCSFATLAVCRSRRRSRTVTTRLSFVMWQLGMLDRVAS